MATDVGDAELQQFSDVAHSSLTSEQKQIKALAKRILKAIQPAVEDALCKESDLAGKPLEKEFPDLEALLDQKLQGQAAVSGETTAQDSTEMDDMEHEAQSEPEIDQEHAAAVESVKEKENGTVQLAPTPEDSYSDHHMSTRDEAADEAAIAAQLGQDALHGTHTDAMEVDTVGGDQPTPGPGPLTPPRSEKDLLAPLANGGIPWYMEPFDPVGTTIHEERWTGREVLRDMSEELSEMDDDAVDGLADSDDMQSASLKHKTVLKLRERPKRHR